MAEWRVRILDGLVTGQVSETATITIGGVAQTININKTTPSAYAQFNYPNGQWPYSLQTRTGFYNQPGKLVFVSGQGSGTLNCNGNGNGDLEIAGDFSVNPPSITLAESCGRKAARKYQSSTFTAKYPIAIYH